MSTILVRSYMHLSDAENARRALLESGIDVPDVQLVSKQDEAGPVQGNFVSGNASDPSPQTFNGFSESKVGNEEQTYDENYRYTANRGTILLTVETNNDVQRDMASDIMQRFGGIDIAARTSDADSRH